MTIGCVRAGHRESGWARLEAGRGFGGWGGGGRGGDAARTKNNYSNEHN